MKPYYETGNGKLYHGDCLEIMPLLEPVDLVLTDPPYGIGNFVQVGGNIRGRGEQKGVAVDWNDAIPCSDVFELIQLKSKNRIIWGANYFNCFDTNGGAIIWKKNQAMPNFSKAEIASCSFYKKVEIVDLTWTNFVNSKTTSHPCERPVSLYVWCIEYAKNPQTVLDPFIGSGTTAVACEQLNHKWIGIEISEKYCEIAAKRIEAESRQLKLFGLTPNPH